MVRSVNLKTAALIGLALVALVIAYPGALQYAAYALFLVCPLMMLLMMGAHGSHAARGSSRGVAGPGEYACPMHPEIRSSFAARCPRCGMELAPAQGSAGRPGR